MDFFEKPGLGDSTEPSSAAKSAIVSILGLVWVPHEPGEPSPWGPHAHALGQMKVSGVGNSHCTCKRPLAIATCLTACVWPTSLGHRFGLCYRPLETTLRGLGLTCSAVGHWKPPWGDLVALHSVCVCTTAYWSGSEISLLRTNSLWSKQTDK